MTDRIMRLLYGPTLAIAVGIIILTPAQMATGLLPARALVCLACVLGGLAVFGFVILLSDRRMASILLDYRDFLLSRRALKPWWRRYWLPRGERLMSICLILLWVEWLGPVFAGSAYLAIAHFSAFVLVVLQMFFAIKRDAGWRAPQT